METKYSVAISGDDTKGSAAAVLIEALRGLGCQVVRLIDLKDDAETDRNMRPCQVCDQLVDVDQLGTTQQLTLIDVNEACPVCVDTANRVWKRFREAAGKEASEIRRQLPQIVRDIRAGAEIPDYYRGFE